MYKVSITLPYRIDGCLNCPFRSDNIIHEDVNSPSVISGVVSIVRRESGCAILMQPLRYAETVNGYNSKCPLSGNMIEIPDVQEGDSKCQR